MQTVQDMLQQVISTVAASKETQPTTATAADTTADQATDPIPMPVDTTPVQAKREAANNETTAQAADPQPPAKTPRKHGRGSAASSQAAPDTPQPVPQCP